MKIALDSCMPGPDNSLRHSFTSPSPAGERTSRASPPGHAALTMFPALTPISLEAAGWLHDIGYAPGLAATGLYPLDGARYLRDALHTDAFFEEDAELISTTDPPRHADLRRAIAPAFTSRIVSALADDLCVFVRRQFDAIEPGSEIEVMDQPTAAARPAIRPETIASIRLPPPG
jgi:hypothetical protein